MLAALPPSSPVTRHSSPATAPVPVTVEAPVIVQQVSLTPTPARSDLLASTEDWTWMELRDFVVSEITARFGPFPRDSRKEHGIFSRFLNAYGADAIAVAQYAFGPTCNGWWGSAPISINRFCRGSDPYFVQPILARLADSASANPS